VRLANGLYSVHSLAEGETFHPVIGPAAEAEALYVRQLALRERRRTEPGELVIWDVGLGAAANAITVLRHTRDLAGPLRLVSFDCTVEPLRFALRHAGALGYFQGYEGSAAQLASERRAAFSDGIRPVLWEFHLADFPALLTTSQAALLPKPHAIMFDAYSPGRNPAMWTLALFRTLWGLLDPARPCAMPTYSRSTLLRVSWLLAGFYVGRGQPAGEKDETTLAANTLGLISRPLDRRWLLRAHRSTSAEPLHGPVYRQAPLTAETWDRLRAHPQFA
jgi:queuine tRNA-ribosyltransferase